MLDSGRLVDQKYIVGCACSYVYNCFDNFTDTINDGPELDIFPLRLLHGDNVSMMTFKGKVPIRFCMCVLEHWTVSFGVIVG